jgi:CDP-paratose 2-epimerase
LLAHIGEVKGQAFNLGGGPENAVSLREVLAEIATLTNSPPRLGNGAWRNGDQLYFVADTHKLQETVGWRARMGWRDGVRDLARWLRDSRADEEFAPARGRSVA